MNEEDKKKKLLVLDEIKENIGNLLKKNTDLLKEIVVDINSWDGSLRDLDFYNLDKYELSVFFGDNLMEFADAIIEGDFKSGDDYFTIDAIFGYITTYTEQEMVNTLINNVEDIVERLVEEHSHLDINDLELLTLLEDYDIYNSIH